MTLLEKHLQGWGGAWCGWLILSHQNFKNGFAKFLTT